jgi:hypothetical protein
MSTVISRPALKRLQTLYSQFERRSIDVGTTAAELRRDRLAWAAQCCQREVKSFNELTSAEGKLLIDALQGTFGQAQTVTSRRQRTSKRDAQKQGTEGRRDQIHPDTTMLDGSEPVFDFIRRELTTLGWDQQRLGAFLRSPHGPNDGRDTIRTLGDANRIHFALKRMAVRTVTSALKGVAA